MTTAKKTRKAKSKPQPPTTLRDMLDRIDQFLVESPHAQALWDVLTALRGPDSNDDAVKASCTCHVRTKAFPRAAEKESLALFQPHGRPGRYLDQSGHFNHHICTAFDALGIKR